jgi:hypothetical protein
MDFDDISEQLLGHFDDHEDRRHAGIDNDALA